MAFALLLSIDAFWSFCLEITKRGSTLSTFGEDITFESIAEILLGIPPAYVSSHEEDKEELLLFELLLSLLEFGTE